MNKFFLIFLSAPMSMMLSAMEIVPAKPEPQAIVQNLLVDKVTDFRLSPVQKYWIGVFFKDNKTCVSSGPKDERTLFLSTAEKKCFITSCSKGGTFLKVYGNKESFIENRCASDCSECDEIVKAIGPNPLMRALESIVFSREQSEFLRSHLVIKDGENVLMPCEEHDKKEPKKQTVPYSYWRGPFVKHVLKPFVFWQVQSLKRAAFLGAGLYVASKIPESWIEAGRYGDSLAELIRNPAPAIEKVQSFWTQTAAPHAVSLWAGIKSLFSR